MATKPAETFSGQIDASGRLLIPARLRRRLGLAPGTRVSMAAAAADTLSVRSRDAALRAAQDYFSSLRRPGELWSEELIAERHAEAKREYGR